MSHTLNIKTEIRDLSALQLACDKLGYKTLAGDFKLYASEESGTGVYLPGWSYPVVIKDGGEIAYDNFDGKWGEIDKLNELVAHYGLEKAKIEARKKGYSLSERVIQEGQVNQLELTIFL